MNTGARVIIKHDPLVEWFSDPDRAYLGTVVGKDDGNLVVRLDEPVMIKGNPVTDFSVQEWSLLFACC